MTIPDPKTLPCCLNNTLHLNGTGSRAKIIFSIAGTFFRFTEVFGSFTDKCLNNLMPTNKFV